MSEELVLYTNPMSRGRIARWMMEETDQPYRTELVGYGEAMKGDDYRAINPMGKVPAIRHGDMIVTEAAAICAYLADAFPAANLAPPPGSPLRAPYYRWLFFASGPIEQAITNKALGFVIPAGKSAMAGYGSFELALDTLEHAVAGRTTLVDGLFTAADVYLGSQIGFGLRFGSIEKRPAFESYWAAISSRPAAVRAAKIDDELIAAAQGAAG